VCVALFLSVSLTAQTNPADSKATMYPSCIVNVVTVPAVTLLVSVDTVIDEFAMRSVLEIKFHNLDSFGLRLGLPVLRRFLFTRCELCAFFVEVGIEVDTVPALLSTGISARQLPGGRFIVAHFEGRYDRVGMAYDAISSTLSVNKWSKIEDPFEVFAPKPYKKDMPEIIMMDVYQRIE
jgi:hypothetical protein